MADPGFVRAEHCRHCACEPPHRPAVPAARTGDDVVGLRRELDSIGEDEAWLWRLVDDADRVLAAAPPAPEADRVERADRTYAQAVAFEDRIRMQVPAAATALASPASWLRPSHRASVSRQLRRDRATAVMAAVQRRRAAEVRDRLAAQGAARAAYLAEHRVTIAAGGNARAELLLVIDDLIDGYAQLTAPPAWFRYGIGAPESTPDWLGAARAAVAARRRTQVSAVPHELR